MTNILQVFLLSMTPIGELRLSIPIGIAVYHIDFITVFLVSVIGNLIPALFILFFLKKVSVYLSQNIPLFQKAFSWWENNTKEKHLEKIKSYGAIGLTIFVGIPLPLTGAWSGALLATILDLPLKKSIPAITAGVVIAGIIVTAMVSLGINVEKYFGWQMLVGLIVFLGLVYLYFKKRK